MYFPPTFMAGMSVDRASTTYMYTSVDRTEQQHGTTTTLRLHYACIMPILRLYYAYITPIFSLCGLCLAYVQPIYRLYPPIGAYAARCPAPLLCCTRCTSVGQRWPDCRCANYALGMVFLLDSVNFLTLGSSSDNNFGEARERQGRRIV
jgi:hypothetical protein